MLYDYIQLTRIQKPIGIWLLFLPCLWGLAFTDFSLDKVMWFFFASVSMRTVGCIVNDCFDKDIDAKVARTKNRPIACGKISVKNALIFAAICTLPSVAFFMTMTPAQKLFSITGFAFGCVYPLFKRFTYFPQLFLGITYNVGIWITCYDHLALSSIFCLYGAAIFWTLAYDTIYAFQDIKDDIKAGVKSTAIRFQKSAKLTIAIFYSCFLVLLLCAKLSVSPLNEAFATIYATLIILIAYRMYYWDPNNVEDNAMFFKENIIVGLFVVALGLLR
ncbi:MAG: 4-hydroxybenzoate polyprenyltransferase, mitochondrial [Holosporales bacterium]